MLFMLHAVYWILCCPYAYHIVSEFLAPHEGLSGPGLVHVVRIVQDECWSSVWTAVHTLLQLNRT